MRTRGNRYAGKVTVRAADNHIDAMLFYYLVNSFSGSPFPAVANLLGEVFVWLCHLEQKLQSLLIRAVVCVCSAHVARIVAPGGNIPWSNSRSALSLLNWMISSKLLTLETLSVCRYCSKPVFACSPGNWSARSVGYIHEGGLESLLMMLSIRSSTLVSPTMHCSGGTMNASTTLTPFCCSLSWASRYSRDWNVVLNEQGLSPR